MVLKYRDICYAVDFVSHIIIKLAVIPKQNKNELSLKILLIKKNVDIYINFNM